MRRGRRRREAAAAAPARDDDSAAVLGALRTFISGVLDTGGPDVTVRAAGIMQILDRDWQVYPPGPEQPDPADPLGSLGLGQV